MTPASRRVINITQDMIDLYARGDPVNHPVVAAIKDGLFPNATEISVTGDCKINVDGKLVAPSHELIGWVRDWHRGVEVKPMLLGVFV